MGVLLSVLRKQDDIEPSNIDTPSRSRKIAGENIKFDAQMK